MSNERWNAQYAAGTLPWDTGEPDRWLVEAVTSGALRGRILEIGCGTGTNAVWLAERGFAVTALDVAPLAIERARQRASAAGVAVDLHVVDILTTPIPGGPFDAAFDRGCFHVFDEPSDRARFAAQVAGVLTPGARWLSLIGSTEGAPRDGGPPRRSARDIADAIEPHLAIIGLETAVFATDGAPPAWRCLSERRAMPAQPSTRRPGSGAPG